MLVPSKTFADVGCDHGYCSQFVLAKGLCDKVILSDVSKGSLDKAKELLKAYIQTGKATAVLGDGFYGVPKDTEQVLIAGMGGYEICKILSHPTHGFMPTRFVFQPMHDTPKLRAYVLQNGGYIARDFTFLEGKRHYDVLVGGKGVQTEAYTQEEILFGRENIRLRPSSFLERIGKEEREVTAYLQKDGLSTESREKLKERREWLRRIIQHDDE